MLFRKTFSVFLLSFGHGTFLLSPALLLSFSHIKMHPILDSWPLLMLLKLSDVWHTHHNNWKILLIFWILPKKTLFSPYQTANKNIVAGAFFTQDTLEGGDHLLQPLCVSSTNVEVLLRWWLKSPIPKVIMTRNVSRGIFEGDGSLLFLGQQSITI